MAPFVIEMYDLSLICENPKAKGVHPLCVILSESQSDESNFCIV